jgi:hypothetical protein
MNELDSLATEIYDYCCSNRADNKSKNPREIGCEFKNLTEQAKNFYRNIAKFIKENA